MPGVSSGIGRACRGRSRRGWATPGLVLRGRDPMRKLSPRSASCLVRREADGAGGSSGPAIRSTLGNGPNRMSIQPNRVIHRIIDQVDRSDWPPLRSRVICANERGEFVRLYRVPVHERYATPLHFWVHALREELAATERREDLVAAAGHALCRKQSFPDWTAEVAALGLESGGDAADGLALGNISEPANTPEIYCMLESACRRSSVVAGRKWLMAHFWVHGNQASWRRRMEC